MERPIQKKPIEYGGKNYIVHEDGVIINCATGLKLKQRLDPDGYLKVTLGRGDKSKNVFVHRIVAEAFIPHPRRYREVHHKDGNRANAHVLNLEWTTHLENVRRAYKRGSYNRKGIHNGRAKFTDEDVFNVRKLYELGMKRSQIAKKYNRGWSTIDRIVKGVILIYADKGIWTAAT